MKQIKNWPSRTDQHKIKNCENFSSNHYFARVF